MLWSIEEVNVLVVSNKLKFGPLYALPHTIEIAVASPNALPRPNIIADIMPFFAPNKTILKSVSVTEAPNAKEPYIWSFLTLSIAVILTNVIVGIIIKAKTMLVDNVDNPPLDW